MDDLIVLKKSDLSEVLRSLMKERKEPEPEIEKQDKLYTASETCKMLRCSKPTLHRWKSEGIIPHLRIGASIRYRESDIKKLIDSKK